MKFAVVGLDHDHVYGMVRGLRSSGAQCAGAYAADPAQVAAFTQAFPDVPIVDDARRFYDAPDIDVIVTVSVSADRAGVAIDAMYAGKDVLAAKPAATTHEQIADLRKTVAETGRIWAVYFGERFGSRATSEAHELITGGVIGTVVQTIGLGPHRLRRGTRPSWFFQRERYGGILTDIASHQIDQFLFLTGSTTAQIVSASVGNYGNPDDPELQDFGEVLMSGPHARGYVRVDWFTPDGLSDWGDGRITVLGTDGYIELRKNVDIAGRAGGDHLFLVDGAGEHYVNCSNRPLTFFDDFMADVRDRTETANPQQMYFTAMELSITAQLTAEQASA
ncbi:Gfo/Idh/MocA family protein [Phytoactinopolyspora mesophila]|uniref:Gfo/Idh/MocA family oxidoreductase n=1 Tax=Phytoactinopolyspora mesophila TaxID=2650750 RepID=A0A7K3LYQ3_9ACTN|nr:Gfo/Idh/MocA family oxidoreductase [Phytoactinopolyspora mesophila]NDL56163.1 gfo/Idh/MocA family oxidoreductase [Phytoactinopolyspora mesophila]